MSLQSNVEDLQKAAQEEARRVIEKLDPEHITSFTDLFAKINECVDHAKKSEKLIRECSNLNLA
ncbi:MAG: hypothetical protein US50_C0032G0007 [Candidatus Nomurabacteria bacterium GW2011_GWB1_37_5]|uniref:Uncharacterized protein n=1 Tax=Candidatus Nomurabacteria bacterium GW2011_GWB1_37_5 TaxID=1618742 RepID=A0A0G0GV46_9BACT|nr:MAG: hypothetical protein US50_C0032G0007 [Candidatus Nomurabacteria bacterium GW2011_GWB1_37_5]